MMRDTLSVLLGTFVLSSSLVIGQAAPQHDQHAPDQHAPAKPSAPGQAGSPHDHATHTHAAAAKITNPVKPDAASIAAGQKLYETNCVSCHGPKGAGDGVQAAKFTPPPSNLADAEWKHGPSDGEIFTVIRNGIPKTAMTSFAKKMTERQTWDVVNFVRSLSGG